MRACFELGNGYPRIATVGEPAGNTASVELAIRYTRGDAGTVLAYPTPSDALEAVEDGEADYLLILGSYWKRPDYWNNPRLGFVDKHLAPLPPFALTETSTARKRPSSDGRLFVHEELSAEHGLLAVATAGRLQPVVVSSYEEAAERVHRDPLARALMPIGAATLHSMRIAGLLGDWKVWVIVFEHDDDPTERFISDSNALRPRARRVTG